MAEEVNGSVPEAAPTAGPEAAPRRRWRPSLTTLILAGLVLGVLAGLFFGEPMGKLRIVGTIFIRLNNCILKVMVLKFFFYQKSNRFTIIFCL